jgi:CheY-like chemotaxis protein
MTQRIFGIFAIVQPSVEWRGCGCSILLDRPGTRNSEKRNVLPVFCVQCCRANVRFVTIATEISLKRILVAEDNPADVYLLREALNLEKQDVEMVVVSDGERAIDYVQRKGEYKDALIPDLIVLDLNLPRSDGSDVLRCIRQTSEYAGVPVVVLTSSDSPRDRREIEGLGAERFITKPSDLDAFLSLGGTLISFIKGATTPKLAQSVSPLRAC